MSNIVISFQEFKEDCRHLAAMLAPRRPNNFFAMMRGGMVVALHLAYFLGMDARRVYPLYKSTRNKYGIVSPVKWPDHRGTTGDMIVDDILDSGKTYENLQCSWPWLKVATLYCKNREWVNGLVGITPIIGRYIETKDYLVLPHEVELDNIERL